MADLTGKTVKSTYKDLLKISPDSDNSGLEGAMKNVTDGEGQSSALHMSTTKVKIDDLEATTADINGGTVDNTPIGNTTQSDGSFNNIGVKGLTSSDSAQTINPTSESMNSINVEDTLITKAGFFGGLLKGTKANYYDFLLIKPYDKDDGGSFVLELELIATSGFDTTLPSTWIDVNIAVDDTDTGTEVKFYTSAGIDENFISSSESGGAANATQFKLKDVSNATLGTELNHNTNVLRTMDTFVDMNGDGTATAWTNTSHSSGGVSSGVANGTYTGKVRFYPSSHSEVLIDNFKADGVTFSYTKVNIIGMSRDLSLLGEDTTDYNSHKVCYPDSPTTQNWVSGHNYGSFRSGANGILYPEAMQHGYSYNEDATAGGRIRPFGDTSTDINWPYYSGYGTGANIISLGSFGIKWPKMNDVYSWIKTKSDMTGNVTDENAIPEITEQPVWGNSTSSHNGGTGDGIDATYNSDVVEHTVEFGAVMLWNETLQGFQVSLFCTSGWSDSGNENATVYGINYNARIISSRGNGKRYVQKVYRTNWGHETSLG